MATRVLIVDPDESLLDVYRMYLTRAGFEVYTATNEVECVENMRDHFPHVLVVEPDSFDGWGERLLWFVQEQSDLPLPPIVVLSRRDRDELPSVAPLPICQFHVKPCSMATLTDSILACN